jgi:CheY-like chemotaxis protein
MKTVLVVEDEDLQRTAFVRALGKLGDFRVVGVGSMREAVAAIDADRPDVIVSDIGLPDRLGVALLDELARRGIDSPLVFVTADVQGYRAFVPPEVPLLEKPVPLTVLRDLVRGLAERRAPGESAGRLAS